jgi:hypothetical protein
MSTTRRRISLRSPLLYIPAFLIGASAAFAAAVGQQVHDRGAVPKQAQGPAAKDSAVKDAASSVNAAMGRGLDTVGGHIEMTRLRPLQPGDSARAAQVVAALRTGLEKYKDVKVAEANGFKPFAPNAKAQAVIHYTNTMSSLREAFFFRPADPSSLLYQRQANGTMKLVGAMYHMPESASLGQLDKRIPLSVARWHLHTNLCVPQRAAPQRWLEERSGKPLFGPESPIVTRKECDLVGGRFYSHLFGWMVHVMPFETDPKAIWGDHPGHVMSHEMGAA